MARMNSTSLYVTTNQIILKANPNNPSSWQDLYRLVPYLRNSLCCVVCGNLLVDPLTPAVGPCQHHLCRKCKGGRKKIKPACSTCKDCEDYNENKNLRILLQCYKQMCLMLINCRIFVYLEEASRNPSPSGVERGAGNLIMLIKEGASFQDEYESKGGLPKSTYSILPCVYTNSSTQTLQASHSENSNIKQVPTNSLYSVMFAGTGNKITIKRKSKEKTDPKSKSIQVKREPAEKSVFKKPPAKCAVKPKRGCRCGNATATPGKLTCCGQRCPCYVESKACIECKCRGCRNPHRPDGHKVRPHIPEIQQIQYQIPQTQPIVEQQLIQDVQLENLDSQFTTFEQFGQRYKTFKVLTGGFNGLPVSANLLLNGPILAGEDDENVDEEEDTEISVV